MHTGRASSTSSPRTPSSLKARLGYTDRRKLDEYLSAVRELEVRIEQAEKFAASQPDFAKPTGIPQGIPSSIRG